MKTIVIVGAGMMGSALSIPARDNGHAVRIVGTHLDRDIIEHARRTGEHLTLKRRLPEGIVYEHIEALDAALAGADLLLCGVSSFGVDWFGEHVLPRVPQGLPILAVTKGLLDLPDGTLRAFPQVWAERAGRPLSLNAIGGPCTSYELADRRQSSVTFCGGNPDILRQLRDMLSTPYYHISLSTDVMGVECAVALKNAYALAVTLAVGLIEREEGEGCTLAYNPQAALFGQSVREMGRILALTGGKADNVVLGAGDLYVTIFGGRTRRLGTLLGRGLTLPQALEALSGVTLESVSIATRTVRAIRTLADRGLARREDFPLLMHLGELLDGSSTVRIPWEAFPVEQLERI